MSVDMAEADQTPMKADEKPHPVPARNGQVRPMRLDDIQTVSNLFFRVFRNGRGTPSPEFRDYFTRAFFSCPSYAPEIGSVVHENAEGQVDSALSVVPMQFSANGRILTGRLLCAFMEDPAATSKSAAQIVLTVRPRLQDFCFTDSAAPISADHTRAVGGQVLNVQSLEWRRLFRPARFAAARAARRLGDRASRRVSALASPVDAGLRRVMGSLKPTRYDGAGVYLLERERFLTLAPRMASRFAVHPVWAPDELGWLLDMAAEKTSCGPLQLRAVRTDVGRTIGCFVYYGQPGGTAQVLNILTEPGGEQMTVAHMLSHLDAEGFTGAHGMAQPFLMNALLRQRKMVFRYRGYFAISTKHGDIRDAIAKGDIYIGGLAGESWSRLISDFY